MSEFLKIGHTSIRRDMIVEVKRINASYGTLLFSHTKNKYLTEPQAVVTSKTGTVATTYDPLEITALEEFSPNISEWIREQLEIHKANLVLEEQDKKKAEAEEEERKARKNAELQAEIDSLDKACRKYEKLKKPSWWSR